MLAAKNWYRKFGKPKEGEIFAINVASSGDGEMAPVAYISGPFIYSLIDKSFPIKECIFFEVFGGGGSIG